MSSMVILWLLSSMKNSKRPSSTHKLTLQDKIEVVSTETEVKETSEIIEESPITKRAKRDNSSSRGTEEVNLENMRTEESIEKVVAIRTDKRITDMVMITNAMRKLTQPLTSSSLRQSPHSSTPSQK